MKNRVQLIFFSLTVTVFWLVSYGFAREWSIEEKAQFGLAQSFNNTKQFEKAQPILQSLYAHYAGDKDLTREMIKAFGYGGRLGTVRDLMDRLEKENPGDVQLLLMIASIFEANHDLAEAQKRYQKLLALKKTGNEDIIAKLVDAFVSQKDHKKTIAGIQEILHQYPSNKYARLQMARVLSWDKQYQASLRYYDALIVQYPDWIGLQREKARLYGWMNDYPKALFVYQSIKTHAKDDVVHDEYLAKKYLYRRYDRHAVAYYKAWITKEPNNPEAIFDLAQIYARLHAWDDAQKLYDRLLDLYPDHYMGKQSQNALHCLRNQWQVSSSWGMFKSGSTSRTNDVKYNMISSRAQKSLSQMWDLSANTQNRWYNFSDTSQIYSNSSGMGLGFYPNSDLSMRMNYDRVNYSERVSAVNNWETEVQYRQDEYRSSFDFKADSYIQNGQTLQSGLKTKIYSFDEAIPLTNRWSLGALYSLADFSDSNVQQTYAGETTFKIMGEPRLLALHYRYEAYGFKNPSNIYFSPHSFHSHEWQLEWRQYLNKDGLFWGSRDVYYEVLYGFNLDVHAQKAHSGQIKWHQDISSRWGWEIEWDIKRYEHASIYHEQQLNIRGVYYF